MASYTDVASARNGTAITPSDSATFAATRALYVGVSGDVKVDMAGGATLTFKSAPVGPLPIQVTRVYSTGTTATDIVALR